jgi:hypothetical protein
MAAEIVKKNQINTEKQQLIIATKTENPEATLQVIADECDTSISYVSEVLKRYNITYKSLEDFKLYQADILLGIKQRIVTSISEEDLQRASLQQKLTSLGIAHDKEQQLRGLNPESRPMIIVNEIKISNGQVEQDSIKQIIDVIPS